MFACQQHGDRVRHRAVIVLFFNELRKIVEAVRIKQAQTREVALQPQLFRGRGQQQNARHALGQLFNGLIFAARRVFAPHQMVRFVDHHDVPLGVAQVLQTLLAAAHEVQRANHQLFGFKRVVGVVLSFGVALIVKQREAQVKAAQHFDQPLMLQSFRHHDQHAFSRAGKQLLMQDHARFDGFTEANFIGQQHARRVAATHIVGDVQLMRDQAGALSAQAAPRHPVLFALIFTRTVAQGEAIHTVDLPGEQAVLRFAEHQLAVEQHFTQHHARFPGVRAGTDIGEQTILFFYFINMQFPTFMAGDRIAWIEHHAGDWRIAAGIQTVFPGRGEKQSDGTRIHRDNSSKSQFAFCIADPALTKCKRHKYSALYL